MVLASILLPFWEPSGILSPYLFGIDFRTPFWVPQILKKSQLGGFWSDFGPKAINRKGIPDVTFSDFFRSPVSASIFESFWVGSGFIFDGFGMLIRHFFRIILDFAIILWHNFRRATLIQFAIFLNLFSDMSDHIFYGILFT